MQNAIRKNAIGRNAICKMQPARCNLIIQSAKFYLQNTTSKIKFVTCNLPIAFLKMQSSKYNLQIAIFRYKPWR